MQEPSMWEEAIFAAKLEDRLNSIITDWLLPVHPRMFEVWKKHFSKLINSKDFLNQSIGLLPLILPPAFAIFLVALIPETHKGENSKRLTQERLVQINKNIEAFRKSKGSVPPSLAHLYAFARANGASSIPVLDAFQNRIDYLNFDDEHYLLRSFGRDGVQNTLFSDQDQFIANLPDLNSRTLVYTFTDGLKPHMYPSPLITGCDSPDFEWHAYLNEDRQNQKRNLIVRHKRKPIIMVLGNHDSVEEFLWLPDARRIVFSATDSPNYRDGVYVWDIFSDTIERLWMPKDIRQPQIQGALYDPISRLGGERRFFISLGGIHPESQLLFLFIKVKDSDALDPIEFYSSTNLFAVKTNREFDNKLIFRPGGVKNFNILKSPLNIRAHTHGDNIDDSMFSQWTSLRFSGPMQMVLDEWQEFSANKNHSLLLPYCLWFLSSLYNSAELTLRAYDRKTADSIRGFSGELASALSGIRPAPSYLRAFGVYMVQRFNEGKKLSYNIANLSGGISN